MIAGTSANITISAAASAEHIYYWSNNVGRLPSSTGLSPILNSDRTLANVQPADAGTYSVTASNEVDAVTTNFTIADSIQDTSDFQNRRHHSLQMSEIPPVPIFDWPAARPPNLSMVGFKNNVLISGAPPRYSIIGCILADIAAAKYSVIVDVASTLTSSSAKLAIYSTMMAGTLVLPANNGTGVCVDAYFEISFNQTPSVGNVGVVHIYDASNPVPRWMRST